jgi:hypothetical protein
MGCLLLNYVQAMFKRCLSASRQHHEHQPPGGLLVERTIDERRLLLTQKNDGFPSNTATGGIGYGFLK